MHGVAWIQGLLSVVGVTQKAGMQAGATGLQR